MRPIFPTLLSASLLCFGLTAGGQNLITTFAPSSVTANFGDTITLALRVQNFTNITSLQFPVTFNNTLLDFVNMTTTTLPGFTAANYNAQPGKVTVSWFPDIAQYPQGVTLADNTTILSLRFRIKQAGSSGVNLANVSPGIEVTRNGQNINVSFQQGGATVVGTGGPAANFQIRANKRYIEKGKIGCMPVTVKGFKDIVSLSYVMHWDTAVLTYQNTGAYNLPDLSTSSFNVFPANSNNLILSWFEQAVQGVTRPDGASIYEVCFLASGPVGSFSVITMDAKGFPPGGATEEEAITKDGQNIWEPGTAVRDTIFVVAPAADPNAVHFIADKDTVLKGGTTCVDIRVKNFKDITSVQLGISYNANLLQLNSPIQFGANPLGLTMANFNTNPPGEIRFTWFDQLAIGKTLPDSTVIFSLCFTAIGDTGKTSPVTFTGFGNFPIEVTQDKKGEVTPGLVHGSVYITALVPPVLQLSPVNAACNGTATGAISALLIQGGPPTNFSWSGPSGSGTTTDTLIKNLLPGTYTVTVTVASGLTATSTATVGSPQALSASASVVNVTCFNGLDGSITLNTSGGTPGYSYSWSGPPPFNNQTTSNPSITGLPAGTYSVTITDSKGCTHTPAPISVSAPPQIQIASSLVVINSVSCFGGNNGSISLPNPTGGTGAHTFSWTGPGGFTAVTKNISGLVAGTYNLTVRDANQCSRNFTYTVTQPNSPLEIQLNGSPTPATCFGSNNGSASVTTSGGTPPHTVAWMIGTQTVASGPNPNNLGPGSYTVVVTDANNCTSSLSPVQIGGPTTPISANPNVQGVTCPGGNNGSITLNPGGGNGGPYTIQWPGNQSGPTLSNLSSGNYVPTISDNRGCTATASIAVNAPQPISIGSHNITPQDGLTLGTITLNNVTGGTPPLSFSWIGPGNFVSNQQNLTDLVYGTYSLTVTDANQCTATFTFNVPTTNILVAATVSGVKPSCNDDGCFTVNIPPGTVAPVSITLSKLPPNPFNQILLPNKDTFEICNLPSGQYEVSLADGASNSFTLPPVVISQREPAVVGSSFTPPFDDMKNGSITLTPIPPTANLTYNWAHGPTTAVVSGLDSGLYRVTVTNLNSGCTSVYSFPLSRTYAPFECQVVQVTPATCANSSNGSITISVTGGDGPTYSFQWSGPNGYTANTQNLSQIVPGVYTCTVIDESQVARQCPVVTVGSQSQVTVANVNILSNYNGFQVSGATVCDGVASVVVSGHVGNFTVKWNNGVGTPTNNTLCGGPYSVTVTDGLGCTATWQGNLTFPPTVVGSSAILSNYNGFGVSCDGLCDGRAAVSAVGGVPPYRIVWPTGQVDANVPLGGLSTAINLCGGEYRVTIIDANNVQTPFTFQVTEPAPLVFQFATLPPENFSICDGEIIATVPAGVPPLSFTWSSLTTGKNGQGTEGRAQDLCPGELVEFVVADANGCRSIGRIRVPYPPDGCFLVRPVITPGIEDGQNDFALITCIEDYPVNTFEVFNRWGQLVYRQEGYNNSTVRWEGRTARGELLPEGVYYYVLTVTISNEKQQFRGHINLIR